MKLEDKVVLLKGLESDWKIGRLTDNQLYVAGVHTFRDAVK